MQLYIAEGTPRCNSTRSDSTGSVGEERSNRNHRPKTSEASEQWRWKGEEGEGEAHWSGFYQVCRSAVDGWVRTTMSRTRRGRRRGGFRSGGEEEAAGEATTKRRPERRRRGGDRSGTGERERPTRDTRELGLSTARVGIFLAFVFSKRFFFLFLPACIFTFVTQCAFAEVGPTARAQAPQPGCALGLQLLCLRHLARSWASLLVTRKGPHYETV